MHHAAGLTEAHPIWGEMVQQVYVQQRLFVPSGYYVLSSRMAAINPLGFLQDLAIEEEII